MFPYESLEVYKKAFQFHGWVYKYLNNSEGLPAYMKNQLGRAALSIPLNIAEGSAKLSRKDRKNFLSIARGSVFECNALICILSSEGQIEPRQEAGAKGILVELSKMLYTMIKNLEDR